MSGPMTLGFELLHTFLKSAGEGSLSCVNTVVDFQISGVLTLLSTNITFKHFSHQSLELLILDKIFYLNQKKPRPIFVFVLLKLENI